MRRRILLIHAHPMPHRSRVNRHLVTAAKPKFRSSRCLRGEEAWLLKAFRSAAAASFRMLSKEREALSSQCSSLSVASNFGVWAKSIAGVTVRHLNELYPDYMIDVEAEQKFLLDHDIIVLQHPFFWYSAPALVKEWLDLVLQYGWAYGEGGTALQGKSLLQAVTTGGAAEVYCSAGHNRHPVREFLLPFEQTARLCGMTYLDPFVVHGTGQLQTEADLAPHSQAYCSLLSNLASGIDLPPSP